QPLPLTRLHRVELRNSIWLAVFQQRFDTNDASEMWRAVESDIAAGLLIVLQPPVAEVWHKAEGLIEPHTPQTGARSLDILHVAAAQSFGAEEFVTFDQRQTV